MKNCYNCIHLDYIDNTSYEMLDGGNICEAREYDNEKKQRELEVNLQRESYLRRGKVCCELKELEGEK